MVTRVSVNTLRHSFAAHLLESGPDILIIQVLLRHDNLLTTARYTQSTIAKTQSPLDRLRLVGVARLCQRCAPSWAVAHIFRRHDHAWSCP